MYHHVFVGQVVQVLGRIGYVHQVQGFLALAALLHAQVRVQFGLVVHRGVVPGVLLRGRLDVLRGHLEVPGQGGGVEAG